MREDFGRSPVARHQWELNDVDYIPAIPDHPYVDENSPLAETEVRFSEDEGARHRSIYLDWHNHQGERELEIVVGYNPISRELLNSAITETEAVHRPLKTLAITMARDNARAHALFFALPSRNCGSIPVPEAGPMCDKARFPWHRRCEIRRNVWLPHEVCC